MSTNDQMMQSDVVPPISCCKKRPFLVKNSIYLFDFFFNLVQTIISKWLKMSLAKWMLLMRITKEMKKKVTKVRDKNQYIDVGNIKEMSILKIRFFVSLRKGLFQCWEQEWLHYSYCHPIVLLVLLSLLMVALMFMSIRKWFSLSEFF